MKAIKSLLVAALAATVMVATANVQAQSRGGGSHGGGHFSGGHFSGGHFNGGHFNGGHFSGGHWGYGIYLGAPLLPWYWGGYPYYGYYPYDYYDYPPAVVVDPYPASYPDGTMAPPPTTEVPRTEGAPAQAPAYMNYCESSRAYFPKVTSCPEGWKFIPSR